MRLSVRKEIWPLKDAFTISRGSRTQTEIVVAELSDGTVTGHGECMANPRYDETQDGVVAALEGLAADIESGALDRAGLQDALPAGAARNALDCAFWDIEAKQANARAWDLADLAAPQPIDTAYTISLDTPDAMGAKAQANAYRPLLKLKLTGDGDLERVAAVRENAPDSRLIVDANEGWTAELVAPFSEQLKKLHVQMIEQPLPEGSDDMLADVPHIIPICADESCHTRRDLERLSRLYDVVNIKLDKTGGLTEALALAAEARQAGLQVMVGCMVATSLAMAPAMLVAQGAAYADLDGPLLLAEDREPPLRFEGSRMYPPEPGLWG